MSRPDGSTSNYGWAVWHLAKAECAPDTRVAAVHAQCAQARATLAAIDQRSDDFSGSTWKGRP